MKNQNQRSPLILLFPLLLLAIILKIASLPQFISENRPDLLALILIYFAVIAGNRICLEIGWLTGLIVDLLLAAPLGINALIISAQVYLVASQFINFSSYSVWQQAVIVGIVNLIVNIVGYWLAHIILQTTYEVNFWVPAILMGVLWFPLHLCFGMLLKTFGIHRSDDNDQQN